MKKYCILLLALLLAACGQSESSTSDASVSESPKYKDASLDADIRVADLVSRMTLEEKVGQLDMYPGSAITTNGRLSTEKMDEILKKTTIGSIHDFYPDTPEIANEVQKYVVENTRLGIPPLVIEEALHGYCGVGSTTFPVSIGTASTWDVELIEKVGKVIGSEARSSGVHFALSPVLGIGREPRWGRTEETFGEDPYLAARAGVAMIKGMQGDSLTDDDAIVAEPKHFGVHSIPEGGRNTTPVYIGEREARTNFLYVFEKAYKEAGALGAMAAYHDWDGIPASADPWLLKDLLRGEWGFKGMVVSDLGAIARLRIPHFVADTPKDAIAMSVAAGMDMQFYDFSHDLFQDSLIEAVNDGSLKQEDLDRAVSSVLYVKFKLGLFENPYIDPSLKAQRFDSKAHKDIVLESAHKSLTLLQNNNNVLPLGDNVKNIALIGELADQALLGGYSPRGATGIPITDAFENTNYNVEFVDVGVPGNSFSTIRTDFLETKNGEKGIDAEYFNNTDFSGAPALTQVENDLENDWQNLSPAPGVSSDNFSVRFSGYIVPEYTGLYSFNLWSDDRGTFKIDDEVIIENTPDVKRTWSSIRSSNEVYLEKGKKHAFTLEVTEFDEFSGVFLRWKFASNRGENLFAKAGEAAARADVAIVVLGEKKDEVGEGLDKINLNLTSFSKEILDEVTKTDTPTVLVLQNGRPLVLTQESKQVDAILETWYAGELSGPAIVDVLTGKVNPSGKLPISFPQHSGHLPMYYNRKRSSTNHAYVDGSSMPLFAFGHGLSYSEFEYSDLQIEQAEIAKDQTQKVSVVVKNVSDRRGAEVVQLYITDSLSSVTTPIIQLRGFKRVELDAGEAKTVELELLPDDLALWNMDMKRVVEPGEFIVRVGAASNDIRLEGKFEVKE